MRRMKAKLFLHQRVKNSGRRIFSQVFGRLPHPKERVWKKVSYILISSIGVSRRCNKHYALPKNEVLILSMVDKINFITILAQQIFTWTPALKTLNTLT